MREIKRVVKRTSEKCSESACHGQGTHGMARLDRTCIGFDKRMVSTMVSYCFSASHHDGKEGEAFTIERDEEEVREHEYVLPRQVLPSRGSYVLLRERDARRYEQQGLGAIVISERT